MPSSSPTFLAKARKRRLGRARLILVGVDSVVHEGPANAAGIEGENDLREEEVVDERVGDIGREPGG